MDDLFGAAPSDPTSDFLRREQELLGSEFSGGAGGGKAGGGEVDYAARASAFPDLEDGSGSEDDFVQAAAPASAQPQKKVNITGDINDDDEIGKFESQYPDVGLDDDVPEPAAAQPSTFFAAPAPAAPIPSFTAQAAAPAEADSEFISSWRVKQASEIAEREAASKAKQEATLASARDWIDNFYQTYNGTKSKNIASNKEAEAAFKAARQEALGKGTTWERIAELVELQDSRSKTTTKSTKDLARFKEVLLSLKRQGENAPGAAGY